jgi:hypothetical protein
MSYKDPEKQKQAQHESYLRHRQKVIESSALSRQKRIQKLNQLKQDPCVDCNNKFPPYVMDFHHRDSSEKLMSVANAMLRWGWDRILKEIEKCDLVCANCHRIREYAQYRDVV